MSKIHYLYIYDTQKSPSIVIEWWSILNQKSFFQCIFDTHKYSGKHNSKSNKIKDEKDNEKQVSYVTCTQQAICKYIKSGVLNLNVEIG